MLRVALSLVLLGCLAAAVVADAARSPRLEQLELRAGDTKIARAAVLRVADLPAGWRPQATSGGEDAPPCGWNLSAFTITGKADATFVRGTGAVYAEVDVLETAAQARRDFAVQVDVGALGCEGRYLRAAFGPTARIVSAQAVAAPRIGDRAAARRWVFKRDFTTIYVDFVAFVRGRTMGALFALIPGSGPLPGTNGLARAMDERLRAATG
jgi:hypothetical protein